jgi:hypothetical protein
MARISTYPRDTFVTGLDKWIGTDANTENLATKNFTANAVADYFNRSAIIDTGSFSWQFQPYSNTQAQAEKTFQQIDYLNQSINILNLGSELLRVSALTLANTTPGIFIINEWVDQAILVHVPSGPSQYAIYNVKSVTPDTEWFFLLELELVNGVSATIQQGDSLVFGYFAAANAVTEVKATFPILVSGTTKPTISLDPTTNTNWNTAYNRSLVSASVTGTTTKTLTLNKQDGGTITASWVDQNTDAVVSVFGRTGAIVAQAGDYTTTLVTEGTNLYFTDQRARNVISSSITGIDYSNTTGIFSLTTGYFIPTTAQSATWDTAYNRSITSAAVTGTTTKTLTLNKQDGSTITASWTDDNTNLVTSVFGRTGAVVAQSGDYTTTQVTEGDNLYFTTARARTAISLTVTGTSGPATYSSTTGILNIPQYQGGVTSFNTRTGAITLTSTDVTDALGFTPENVANKSNDTALGTSATLYPTQNAVKTYVDSATAGGIILQGDWNAATNTPNITGTTQTGFAWRVSVAGNTNLGGITDWLVNDLAVKTATGWIKIDNTESVTSVFGRFGTVVAQSGDYNTDLVTEGTTNLYFTTARARTSISAGTGITYNSTTGVISSSGGSVTSVGLSMPSAFTVTNSPVTSTGTLTVTGAGTTAQYIRGDGSLATLPGTSAEARSIVREVYNKTGATLTKGTVVYINSGQGNLPAVTKAIATGDMTSAQTFGIVQTDITDQNNGFVVVTGGLENLDTQGLGVGTQLYLSSTVAGAYTTVKQYAPAHLVYIAIVVRDHPTQGVIEVNIQNGYELDELHNVSARNPANNDIIAYNTTTSLWEKKSIATTLGYTPANAATTITINNTAFDLSANRTWSVGTVTSIGLALGTSGTDANISNSPITTTGEITLNLPTASATNRGLLSNGDWTTFNSKQTALNGTGFVKSTAGVISYDPSTYTPTSRTLTINGVTYDLSADRSWTVGASTSARTEQTFTATAGTNTFTITGGYVVGLIDVYVNGVKYPPADYTASNGTTVVITGLVAADIVSVISYTANITVPSISGSGTANSIARFVGSTAIGDSGITDNGTTVTLVSRALSGTSATFTTGVSVTNGYGFTSSLGSENITFSNSWFGGIDAIYQNSGNNNDFGIYTNGGTSTQAKFYITNAGNVGIGTTSPSVLLHLSGSSGEKLRLETTASTPNFIGFYTGATRTHYFGKGSGGSNDLYCGIDSAANMFFESGGSTRLFIGSTGNVGIGTTSPTDYSGYTTLHLNGKSGGNGGLLRLTASDNSSSVNIYAGGSQINFNTTSAVPFVFLTQDTPRLTIASGDATFTTAVTARCYGIREASAGRGGFYPYNIISGAGTDYSIGLFSESSLWFAAGGGITKNLVITSAGNVGIGTTAPSEKLYVQGKILGIGKIFAQRESNGADTLIQFKNEAGADRAYIKFGGTNEELAFYAGSGSTENMRIYSGGKTQINASASDYTLTMYNSASNTYGMYLQYSAFSPNSTNYEFAYFADSTNSKFIVWSNGSVINRTGSYGTISDVKFKENIVDATPKLGDIAKLKVRNFNLKGESTKQIGFIAQEFEEVFPNMVDVSTEKGTDGETYKSIKTSVLIPMLVKAIQELSAKVTALENK